MPKLMYSPAITPSVKPLYPSSRRGAFATNHISNSSHLSPAWSVIENPVTHHIRFAQPRAMGMKVGDEWAVPLCFTHHRLLHDAGNEADWWAKQKIDPLSSPLTKLALDTSGLV